MDRIKAWAATGGREGIVDEEEAMTGFPFMISVRTTSTTTLSSPRFGYRPPPVVTITEFDDNDTFICIAKSMLYRYEYQEMSARDVINATLVTSEEKRTFMESLEMRGSKPCSIKIDGEEQEMKGLVKKVAGVFDKELKAMWKESTNEELSDPIVGEDRGVVSDDDDDYCRHSVPKTPKAMGFETPKTSSKTRSVTSRRRRHFFCDSASRSPGDRQRRNKPTMKIIALVPSSPLAAGTRSLPHIPHLSPILSSKEL